MPHSIKKRKSAVRPLLRCCCPYLLFLARSLRGIQHLVQTAGGRRQRSGKHESVRNRRPQFPSIGRAFPKREQRLFPKRTHYRPQGLLLYLSDCGTDQVSGSTDTIIVGMMDTKNHTLNFVHIPRDTLVNVSWNVKRVNTIMNYRKSINGLIEGITDLIGYKVDSYAVVNLNAFVQLVDTIGGVNLMYLSICSTMRPTKAST